MNSVAEIRFSELTGLFERISRSKTSSQKQIFLNTFISQWREYTYNHDQSNPTIQSFYPAMRLILPILDKTRSAYGIKEFTLAKLYCSILCLETKNEDFKKIMKAAKHRSSQSDLAESIFNILKTRSPSKGSITIEEVNNRLDKIAEASGKMKTEIIKEHLMYFFQTTNALDQKWLIRIILENVSLGLSAKIILKSFHPLCEEFYNVTNDLRAMCEKFSSFSNEDDNNESSNNTNPNKDKFQVQLFRPFKPMLSARCDNLESIESKMDHKPFIYEIKFDGERFQLHKNETTYRYWSRNGLEWTTSYGQDFASGSGTLTQFIHGQFKSSVRNCILDGEMMSFNIDTETMGTKTKHFDIKSVNVEKTGYMPCFIIFDVLYLNDEVLTNRSLKERKSILDSEILESELKGKIQISKWIQATSKQECLDAFNVAIENCEEGLMVKKLDSLYKVKSRVSGWFKLKPDYILGLHEELDCVIVGGYLKASNLIGHFLCAVRSDNNENKYISFTQVGSGLSRKVLYEFNMKMAKHWKTFTKNNPPNWLVLSGKSRDIPDMYIEPENSFIVQLKAAEIVSSIHYGTGCTLRFARIDCFREDKSPTSDCMSLKHLNDLRVAHKGKLALHPLEINSDEEDLMKSKNSRKSAHKRACVPEYLKSSVPIKKPNDGVDETSIFRGKEFCIMLSNILNQNYDKKKIETFVYENGGPIVQNPRRSTFAVIINNCTLKVQNLIKNNQYDVILVDWMVRCIRDNKYVDLKPSDYFSMKKSTKEYFSNLFDFAGDSFTDELSLDEVKILLENMDSKSIETPLLTYESKSNLIDEIMLADQTSYFLNGCVLYFYLPNQNNVCILKISQIERLKCKATLAGAIISDDLQFSGISHVIIIDLNPEIDFEELYTINRIRERKFYIVSLRWLNDSMDSCTRLMENLYFQKFT